MRDDANTVINAHRRWGKDELVLQAIASRMYRRVGNYWHALPEYSQANKAIWDAVDPRYAIRRIDHAFPKELFKQRNHDMRVGAKFNASSYKLVGCDSPDTLVGAPPIFVAFSEYAIANPEAWAYLSPIIAENKGKAVFISTTRGDNHFRTLCEGAAQLDTYDIFTITAEQSAVFSTEQLLSIEKDLIVLYGDQVGHAYFRQEYLCEFVDVSLDSIYVDILLAAKENKLHTEIYTEEKDEYSVYFDVGGAFTCAWFYNRTRQAVTYCHQWIRLRFEAVLETISKFNIVELYLPRDSHSKLEMVSPFTTFEVFTNEGYNVQEVPNFSIVSSQLAAKRVLTKINIDSKACKEGIFNLSRYKGKHDITSHYEAAFRYMSVMIYEQLFDSTIEQVEQKYPLPIKWGLR
jgi:hypothetical protein